MFDYISPGLANAFIIRRADLPYTYSAANEKAPFLLLPHLRETPLDVQS
jgi:hypothetical protein